jgi:hypothetical protein
LGESNDSCEHDDSDEYEAQDEVGKVALSLNNICDDAEDGSYPQHDGEPICDFLEETNPSWSFFLLWKFVISFLKISLYGSFSC